MQYFRENLKLGPGGETGLVDDMLRNTTERIGANIMGKRMFEMGERMWPENAPFYLINKGPKRALELARYSVINSMETGHD